MTAAVRNPWPHVTRRVPFDGRQLFVVDGLFADGEIATLYRLLNRLPCHLNDIDTDATQYARHWKSELLPDFARATPVLKDCIEIAAALFPPSGRGSLQLSRAHLNVHLYGDAQHPHTDLTGGVTVLYYANPEWREAWMGETIFYDAGREPIAAVAPRPGRLAVFDADIVHRGGVPSRECFDARMTVACKFVRVE